MSTLKIAFRNIFRNGRRSAVTILAFSVGAVSMLLFGGYIFAVISGVETNVVQAMGHIHMFRKGYFQYGAGSPGAYSFGRYDEIKHAILQDPELKDLVRVVTPTLSLSGIAGNFPADASKPFSGRGIVPSDRRNMRRWNDYGLDYAQAEDQQDATGIRDEKEDTGIIGTGMARMLRLCGALHIDGCDERRPRKAAAILNPGGDTGSIPGSSEDFSFLLESEPLERRGEDVDQGPKLDLLAVTAAGAPNVVSMFVSRAETIPDRATDDRLIIMHLSLAQELLFGRNEKKVTEMVVQLNHTADMPMAKARLQELLRSRGVDMEVMDLEEVYPPYGRIVSFLFSIFAFIAVNMGLIVLFTVANTMSMSVMERVNEIGAVRAMGVRRGGVMRQFLLEGFLLGIAGATVGVGAAVILAGVVNGCGFTYVPPGGSHAVPLTVQLVSAPILLVLTWLGLVSLAGISSLVPARRAGRMVIVDALRHI